MVRGNTRWFCVLHTSPAKSPVAKISCELEEKNENKKKDGTIRVWLI